MSFPPHQSRTRSRPRRRSIEAWASPERGEGAGGYVADPSSVALSASAALSADLAVDLDRTVSARLRATTGRGDRLSTSVAWFQCRLVDGEPLLRAGRTRRPDRSRWPRSSTGEPPLPRGCRRTRRPGRSRWPRSSTGEPPLPRGCATYASAWPFQMAAFAHGGIDRCSRPRPSWRPTARSRRRSRPPAAWPRA